jgi:hypothetical protein
MCVLQLTLGKLISANVSLVFWIFSVERPDGLSLRSDGCRSDVRMVLMSHQDGDPTGSINPLATALSPYPTKKSLFWLLVSDFL